MSAPQWEPVDNETNDLLSLVATGPVSTGTADREWEAFVAALHSINDYWGVIHPNALRSVVRGHVAPNRIGAFTNRALKAGLIAPTGEWEVSDDKHGKNAGKPARVYRLVHR
jgi:hypothetical protein